MQNATSNKVVPLTEHAMKLRGLAELDSLALAFEVHTRAEGPTGGRHYLLRADNLADCCGCVKKQMRAHQQSTALTVGAEV